MQLPVKTKLVSLLLLACALRGAAQNNNASSITPAYAFAEPAISPDGKEIAFASGGDIWTVPASGGEARLLVSHPAFESRPLYSPNGRYLAFQSSRTGNGDLYVLDLQDGTLRRLTYDDAADEINSWSPDSKWVYFSSSDRDISSMRDVFRIPVGGGTPMLVSDNRYISEFLAAPAPDGKTVALVARGFGLQQWWRKGHSHLDESELWLLNTADHRYKQIAPEGAKQLWPMWSPDGKTLYYMSDRNGTQNLWVQPLGGTAKPLTKFTAGRVLWPTISGDGRTITFERDFKVWTCNTATGEARPLAITRRGVPASPATEHPKLTSGFTNLAVSPDGKKVAFTSYGDVFVASAKDGGDAVRITTTAEPESQLVWTPNSNRLIYVSRRNGPSQLFQYNFITGKEAPLTASKGNDGAPVVSPDGKKVAFIRNDRELHVIDLAGGGDKVLTQTYFDPGIFEPANVVAWAPDNQWIAYAAHGTKSFRNVYVIPAAGGEGKPVSFLANSYGSGITWDKEGKSILFTTAQRTETGYVAKVDLVPQAPRFRENQFRDLFTDEVPTPTQTTKPVTTPAPDTLSKTPAKGDKNPSVRVVWEGIRQRLNMLPLGVDAGDLVVTKDGKTLVVMADVAGQSNLYTWSLDELAREPPVLKQLTTTPGRKGDIQVSNDGKEVYYLENGRIQAVSLDSKAVRPIAVTAELDVDFSQMKMEVFHEAWEGQNKGFYDPAFHGADWNAVRREYEPYAAGATTGDELRRIISLMLGELNASHSGISAPPSGGPVAGYLGVRFDPATYDKEGKLKISEIINLGPVSLAGGVTVGDYLVAVDGTPVSKDVNLDQLLENKINKRVVLTIGGSATRGVQVRPVSMGAEKQLLYKQWVQEQRAYVAKVSNGRLGYVHMIDMSAASLDQLYLDMDVENHAREGVVVDIRNNNGGFVNPYAIDVLARRGYLTMTVRNFPAAPARSLLGQRSLEAPTILVTNQHSLSDAEDFTEGYRTLGLGKVVGEPTAGWIIFTSSLHLMDGSVMRMPFTKITDNRGQNMELHPRPVDIPVTKPLGEENKDPQLDAAVKELLREIDQNKNH